jgi:hypothetical protein
MATTSQNFMMYAGDHVTIEVALLDTDGQPLGNIDELEFYWGMGPTEGPATVMKTNDDSHQIAIISDATIAIYIVPEDTNVVKGQRRHELCIVDSFGAIETVMVGMITVHPSSVQPVLGAREYAAGPAGRRGRAAA